MAAKVGTQKKAVPTKVPMKKYQNIGQLIQRGLASLRADDICTDFEVLIQDRTFRCHKIVLASVSDYFRAMFESGMRETNENQTKMDNISPEAFQVILDLLYYDDNVEDPLTDRTDEEMIELFRVADMFSMSFLCKLCIEYFKKSMDAENCIERWKSGKIALIEELVKMSWQHILENFEKVVKASVLTSLEFVDFLAILQDEHLSVTNEIVVWNAVADWIDFDRKKRGDYLCELLKQCCLTEIDYQYLVEEMCFDEKIRTNNSAARLLRAAIKASKHPGNYGNTEFRLRPFYMKEQIHIALGKADGEMRPSMVGYNSENHQLAVKAFPHGFPVNRTEFACCIHGRTLYICGGTGPHANTMYKYTCTDDKWQECLGKMQTALKRHALVATDDSLYAVGGRSGYSINGTVMKYDLNTSQWEFNGDIIAPVEQPSAICLNDKIYIIGGSLEGKPEPIPSDCVQVYDIKTETSTIVCNLPNPCKFSCAVSRLEEIYVATSNGEIIRLSGKNMQPELIVTVPDLNNKSLFSMGMKCDVLSIYGGTDKYAMEDIDRSQMARNDIIHVCLKSGKVTDGKPLPEGYVFYGGVDAVVGLFNT